MEEEPLALILRMVSSCNGTAPRIDFPDAVYHVTSRGNGRAVIFCCDDDRQRFVAQLADNCTPPRSAVRFALLDNHFHLLARTARPICPASCSVC